ncbi:hypothetical protein BaRGS_00011939, partial [Batillaria attramentaria]
EPTKLTDAKKAASKPPLQRRKRKTKPASSGEKRSAKGHNHDDNPPMCDFRFRHSSCNRPCCARPVCQTDNCPIHVNHSYYTWFDE